MKKVLALVGLAVIAVLGVLSVTYLTGKISYLPFNSQNFSSIGNIDTSINPFINIITNICYTLTIALVSIVITFIVSIILSFIFWLIKPAIIKKLLCYLIAFFTLLPVLIFVLLTILLVLPQKKLNIFILSVISTLITALPFIAKLTAIIQKNISNYLKEDYILIDRIEGLGTFKILWKYKKLIFLKPCLKCLYWLIPAIISGVIITNVFLKIPDSGTAILTAIKNYQIKTALLYMGILSFSVIILSYVSKIIIQIETNKDGDTHQVIFKNFMKDYLFNNKICVLFILFIIVIYVLCIGQQIFGIYQGDIKETADAVFVSLTFVIGAIYLATILSWAIVRIAVYENFISKTISFILEVLYKTPVIILYLATALIFSMAEGAMIKFVLAAFCFGVVSAIRISGKRCESIKIVKQQEFVKAARRYGSSESHIINKHLLPLTKPEFAASLFYNCAQITAVIIMFGIIGIGLDDLSSGLGVMIAKGLAGDIASANVIGGLAGLIIITVIFGTLEKMCDRVSIYKKA